MGGVLRRLKTLAFGREGFRDLENEVGVEEMAIFIYLVGNFQIPRVGKLL